MTKKSLDVLKKEADALDIKYPKNITAEKLQAEIDKALAEEIKSNEMASLTKEEIKANLIKEKVEDTIREKEKKAAAIQAKNDKLRNTLKRVRITSNIPQDAQHAQNRRFGRTFRVSNKELGTYSAFVLFGQPYHINDLLYNFLKDQTITVDETHIKDMDNHIVLDEKKQPRKTHTMPKYNIEILPPLTREETIALGKKQLGDKKAEVLIK